MSAAARRVALLGVLIFVTTGAEAQVRAQTGEIGQDGSCSVEGIVFQGVTASKTWVFPDTVARFEGGNSVQLECARGRLVFRQVFHDGSGTWLVGAPRGVLLEDGRLRQVIFDGWYPEDEVVTGWIQSTPVIVSVGGTTGSSAAVDEGSVEVQFFTMSRVAPAYRAALGYPGLP
jgi:hypothetical protein